MQPGNLYRAKLSDADRLLFCFGACRGERALILLEVIRNHDYENSRFMRGAVVAENRLVSLEKAEPLTTDDVVPLAYLNPAMQRVHLLDKIISFDDDQQEALQQPPPLILIGAAGSGKTVLTLEKLRQLPGEVLYLTHSPYLVDNARTIYFSHNYENEAQEVDFLSFREFVESIAVPAGRPLGFADFVQWLRRSGGRSAQRDSHKLYEEFNGVLTGSAVENPCLTREEYLSLGVRRSIFTADERPLIYDLFLRYLAWLPQSGCYDLNLVCYDHHKRCQARYDFIVADEVQDMTTVQLSLALQALRTPGQFVLCGDSNQIVHPNFFSWAGVKTWFHDYQPAAHGELVRILNANYRNAPEVTEVANRLLRIKQARFGSIDRESHYLIKPVSERAGGVTFLADTAATRRELDQKTSRSTRFAVIVLRDEDKEAARQSFATPLVFSVREAKGLEYEHIILPGLVSGQAAEFNQIVTGVTEADLENDFKYGRARDKSDRSLDAFKFYINALYVALTRAIAHVYILERQTEHPLLRLLRLQERGQAGLVEERSSDDEWRAEALRLERQGKLEQSQAIADKILQLEPVPWVVITPDNLIERLEQWRQERNPVKNDLFRPLADYTICYGLYTLFFELKHHETAIDKIRINLARNDAMRRLGIDYHQRGHRDLWRKIERHGVDFRNQVNLTPLMMAVQLGQERLVAELIAAGASRTATDSWGCTPLHLALRVAYQNVLHARNTLPQLYALLVPPATNLRVGNRLVQLDRHRLGFFLFHSMIARLVQKLTSVHGVEYKPGFTAADFEAELVDFPESVIPKRYGKRSAISATLAGNEVDREARYNRQLFWRISRGYYLPNPAIELERDGQWHNLYQMVHVAEIKNEYAGEGPDRFLDYLERERNRIVKRLNAASGLMPAGEPEEQEAGAAGFVDQGQPLPEVVKLQELADSVPIGRATEPTKQAERQRHADAMSALGNHLEGRFGEIAWMQQEPEVAAWTLGAFLKRVTEHGRIGEHEEFGLLYAIAQLGEWCSTGHYNLMVEAHRVLAKFIGQLNYREWWNFTAPAISAVCDGNLKPILNDIKYQSSGDVATYHTFAMLRAMELLYRYRNLNPAIMLTLLRRIIQRGCRESSDLGPYLVIVNQAVAFAATHFPNELNLELQAAIRLGLIDKRVLTLGELAASSALTPWQKTESIGERILGRYGNRVHCKDTYQTMGQLLDSNWKRKTASVARPARKNSYSGSGSDVATADYDSAGWFDDEVPQEFEVKQNHHRSNNRYDFDEDFKSSLKAYRQLQTGADDGYQPRQPPGFGAAPATQDLQNSKVGRNAPCPCGSGKKYKRCCGSQGDR